MTTRLRPANSRPMSEPNQPASPAPLDQELLRRFKASREEAAFRELVRRHGPLVLAVCRRNTFSEEDAEDAFQAAFLVLAESARKVRRERSLSAWLYGVALRTSSRVRRAHRRDARRLEEEVVQYDDPLDELLARHEGMIADEELAALPEKLRAPLVLRYLAGKSNHETAEELGISVAALEGRLKRGKAQLRTRLLRRGVTLAAVIAVLKATRVHACELPEPLTTAAAALACGGQQAASTNTFTHTIARQELATMNAILAPKLIASGLISGLVLFAVGSHLALSQNAGQSRQTLALKHAVDKAVSEADAAVAIEPPRLAIASSPEAATVGVKPEIIFHVQDVDAKPRTELERNAESRLGDAFEHDVAFIDAPLAEVVEYLQTEADVSVILDSIHLDEIGVAEDTPVTVNLPEGLRLESVLEFLLDPLELEAIVKDEVIYITTRERAAEILDTRVYATNLLRSDPEALAQMLTKSVRPDSWTTSGGAASIGVTPSGALIIRQTFAGHREVAGVLKQMATTES
ncbi:MAG: sigma-70 family RNA polymerase sigma factor, partial [Planctomycetales bacterium]|nr:sigma-70 family RNA polymerase sigma factor [Planctomycetales bacterium]